MCFVNSFGGAVDVSIAVGETHHKGRRDHSPLDQLLEEQSAKSLRSVAILIMRCENQIAGPPDEIEETLKPILGDRLIYEGTQTLALPPEKLDHISLAVDSYGFERSRQSMGLGTVGCGQQENPRLVVIQTAE